MRKFRKQNRQKETDRDSSLTGAKSILLQILPGAEELISDTMAQVTTDVNELLQLCAKWKAEERIGIKQANGRFRPCASGHYQKKVTSHLKDFFANRRALIKAECEQSKSGSTTAQVKALAAKSGPNKPVAKTSSNETLNDTNALQESSKADKTIVDADGPNEESKGFKAMIQRLKSGVKGITKRKSTKAGQETEEQDLADDFKSKEIDASGKEQCTSAESETHPTDRSCEHGDEHIGKASSFGLPSHTKPLEGGSSSVTDISATDIDELIEDQESGLKCSKTIFQRVKSAFSGPGKRKSLKTSSENDTSKSSFETRFTAPPPSPSSTSTDLNSSIAKTVLTCEDKPQVETLEAKYDTNNIDTDGASEDQNSEPQDSKTMFEKVKSAFKSLGKQKKRRHAKEKDSEDDTVHSSDVSAASSGSGFQGKPPSPLSGSTDLCSVHVEPTTGTGKEEGKPEAKTPTAFSKFNENLEEKSAVNNLIAFESDSESQEPGGEPISKTLSCETVKATDVSHEGSPLSADSNIIDAAVPSDDQKSKLKETKTIFEEVKAAFRNLGKQKSQKKSRQTDEKDLVDDTESKSSESGSRSSPTPSAISMESFIVTKVDNKEDKSEETTALDETPGMTSPLLFSSQNKELTKSDLHGAVHVDSTNEAEKKESEQIKTIPCDGFPHLTGNREEVAIVTAPFSYLESTSGTKPQKESSSLDSSEPGDEPLVKPSMFASPKSDINITDRDAPSKEQKSKLKGSKTYTPRPKSGFKDLRKDKLCNEECKSEQTTALGETTGMTPSLLPASRNEELTISDPSESLHGAVHVNLTHEARSEEIKTIPSDLPYDALSCLTGNIKEDSTVTNMASTSEAKPQKESSNVDSTECEDDFFGKPCMFALPNNAEVLRIRSCTTDSSITEIDEPSEVQKVRPKSSKANNQRLKSASKGSRKRKLCLKDQQTEKKDLAECSSTCITPKLYPDSVSREPASSGELNSFHKETICEAENNDCKAEETKALDKEYVTRPHIEQQHEEEAEALKLKEMGLVSKMASCMPSPAHITFTHTTSDPTMKKLLALHLDSSDQSANEGKSKDIKTLDTLSKVKPTCVPAPPNEKLNDMTSDSAESDLNSFRYDSTSEEEAEALKLKKMGLVLMSKMASCMPSPAHITFAHTTSDPTMKKLLALHLDSSDQSANEGKSKDIKTLDTLSKVKPTCVPAPPNEKLNDTTSDSTELDLSSFHNESTSEEEAEALKLKEMGLLSKMASCMPSPAHITFTHTTSDPAMKKLLALHLDSSDQSVNEGKSKDIKTLDTHSKVKPTCVPAPPNGKLNDTTSDSAESDLNSLRYDSTSEEEAEALKLKKMGLVLMSKMASCMPSPAHITFTHTTSDPAMKKLLALHLDSSDQSHTSSPVHTAFTPVTSDPTKAKTHSESKACQLEKTKTPTPEVSAISSSQKGEHTQQKHLGLDMAVQNKIASMPAEHVALLEQSIIAAIVKSFDDFTQNPLASIPDAAYTKLESAKDTLIVLTESTFKDLVKDRNIPSTGPPKACGAAKDPEMATPSRASSTTGCFSKFWDRIRRWCQIKRRWKLSFRRKNKIAAMVDLESSQQSHINRPCPVGLFESSSNNNKAKTKS
ncbi:uncharacterized protein LOC118563695 isoform X2 [Fundulus heteroclitus]|uniref:uncharacterized protein LOC118563695 isoform X2 n=1 Tax=Fundulus heteroclitus TaxID=8078 RepID=UPI00165AC4A4|nr:uncharacterized protein LOC118563695 isoform X2 [Fundulus heteroclitus]